MSKSNAKVIMPIDEYNKLIPKNAIDNLIFIYNKRVEGLEYIIRNSTDGCSIIKAKIEIYNTLIWDLQTLDTKKNE